jgi:hypothetical protein
MVQMFMLVMIMLYVGLLNMFKQLKLTRKGKPMLQELLLQTEKEIVKTYINNIMKKYIENEKNANQGELEHIIDLFNAKQVDERILKIPVKTAIEKSKKWVKKLSEQAGAIPETECDTEIVHDFNNGFKFVKLLSKSTYAREGKLMSNCVLSYFGRNDVLIYSLRDKLNKPHCTLEVKIENNYVNQIKGKGKGSVHPKYIKYVLFMLQKLGQKLRSSELTYLGYDEIDGDVLTLLNTNFVNLKTLTFDGKMFLYRYQKFTRIQTKTKG